MKNIKDHLIKHIHALCLDCGSRHCGSPGERVAADYIESEFQKMGYETVREEYPTIGWNCHKYSLKNVTKDYEIPCASVQYFSNPICVESKLTLINSENIDEIEQMDLDGKLCFIESAFLPTSKEGFKGVNMYSERLDACGAAGAIFISAGFHTDYMPSTKSPRSPKTKAMGVASVSQMGAYEIARNIDDVYRLEIQSKKFDTVSSNIIARYNGGPHKGVIGAHYDTAPEIQGATDNAGGVAILLETARLYKDKLKDYSLDFCAFSAEEYIVEDSPPGSGNYVERHKLENLKWYLNIDGGGSLLSEKYAEISHRELLPKLDFPVKNVREAILGGDDKPFSLSGIPTVWLKDKSIFNELHTKMDDLEHISFDKLEKLTKDYLYVLEQLVRSG